jgi:hypothetical protein
MYIALSKYAAIQTGVLEKGTANFAQFRTLSNLIQ